MLIKLVFSLFLILTVPTSVQAAEDSNFNHFSISINVVPSLQNSTDTSVPGESKISDTAYQYQANYINQPQEYNVGPLAQKLDYYSLRAFAYKHAYTDPDLTGSAAAGVGSVDGFAFLYGQRYLMANKGYQGFGFGWYAGYAMINDIWVQQCCGTSPTTEKRGIPIAAAEIFYKFNATSNIYIEPGVTIAYESKGTGPVNIIPALIVGGEF